MTAKKKSVAKKPATNLSPIMAEMEEDAGAGMENVTSNDIAIPFFRILQKNGPEVDEGNSKYIEGAKPGNILNTVTFETFDSVILVPCAFQRRIYEWWPRESNNNGIVAVWDLGDDYVKKATQCKDKPAILETPSGTHLIDTCDHYCLHLHPNGQFDRVVLAMSSTQLKRSKRWNSIMMNQRVTTADGRMFTPPIYGNMYTASTVAESNAKGSWHSWQIELLRAMDDLALYNEAKAFAAAAKGGLIRTADREQGGGEVSPPSDTPAY